MALSKRERMRQMVTRGDGFVDRDLSQRDYLSQYQRNARVDGVVDSDVDNLTIYDQVDGTPMRVERMLAMQSYLRKLVAVCSACRHPSVFDNDIANHIRVSIQNAEAHRNAEALQVNNGENSGMRCSGCGALFIAHPQNVHEHITRMKQMGPAHQGARVLVIQRFSLEPPVLEKPQLTLVTEADTAPQASVDDRRAPRRHRRRRRHHKGKAAA